MLGLDLLDHWEHKRVVQNCSEFPPSSQLPYPKSAAVKMVLRKGYFEWILLTHHSLCWYETFPLLYYLTLSLVMFIYCPSPWKIIFVSFVLVIYVIFLPLKNIGFGPTICWVRSSPVPVFLVYSACHCRRSQIIRLSELHRIMPIFRFTGC